MIWMVNALAAVPLASISAGGIHASFKWIYYIIFTAAIAIKSNFRKLVPQIQRLSDAIKSGASRALDGWNRVPKKWVIVPLLVLAFLTSFTAATMPDEDLHVSVLDVGEGDSILVRTGSQNILIDGEPSPQAITLALGRQLPFWDRQLDMVILTHPHLDHLSGLIEVLQRYRVSQVLATDLTSTSPAFQQWMEMIRTKNIPYTPAYSGRQIKLRDGACMDILNPPNMPHGNTELDLENDGVVARLTLDKISFLFTADIEREAENQLLSQRADLAATVLKVAHHGSDTSTTPDFLAVVHPQIAVISCGKGNTFGHPSEKVLSGLQAGPTPITNIFRTDQSGTIEFITNGQILRVKTTK